jgi:serine/threonine-protein kinase
VDPLIGTTLASRYLVLERIGSGAMGVVYHARNVNLGLEVALKVIGHGLLASDTERKRFRREAVVLSKLNHPHINQIYDFDSHEGMDFLVMEFIRGKTLEDGLESGPFAEAAVLSIGVQVAEALEEAHSAEIIHCDLKPGNVMVNDRGSAKVLDFGLAKALQATSGTLASVTEPGHVAGTLPYMAPEQFQGAAAGTRSDLHALGALLYELATGRRAFPQDSAAAVIEAILKQPPISPRAIQPGISPGLEGIILRLLEKEPERRFPSATQVIAALQSAGATRTAVSAPPRPSRRRRSPWALAGAAVAGLLLAAALVVFLRAGGGLRMPAPGRIESLAVLPLNDLSGDPSQGYFADGMTDALITRLAQIGGLRVISRTSVMRYRGAPTSLPQIASDLDVDAVVEGSVLRSGNRVRISARLVEVDDDRHLWANTYEREIGDVLGLQRDLAGAIADQVRVRLTADERERLGHSSRVNPEAYDEYLKGRQEWSKRSLAGLEQARRYFTQATKIDPEFAPAYAGLADVYVLHDQYSGLPAGEGLPRAEEAARRALELDSQLAEAYPALGLAKLYHRWDWTGAEYDFKRAIELRPSYATAQHWYSIMLRGQKRFDEALVASRRALALDPLSLIINANLGDVYFFARRYDEAIRQHRIGRQMDAKFAPTHLYLGMAFAVQGEKDSAIASCNTARSLAGDGAFALGGLGYALARAGRRAEAEQVLGDLNRRANRGQAVAFDIGLVLVGLGKEDQALEWIDRACREQPSGVKDLGVDPRFDPLREDPRFQEILRRIGVG